MPSRLSEVLSGATAVMFDNDRQATQDPACAVRALRQLAPFQEAQKQHRMQPLRPLLHRLRCGVRADRGAVACGAVGFERTLRTLRGTVPSRLVMSATCTPRPLAGGASRPPSWR